MTSRTHDVFAFASLITITSYYPPAVISVPTLIASPVANIIGALLPDIDQATNRLWDLIPGGNFIGRFLRKIFLSHRTLSHSFLGVFLVSKLLEWVLPKIFNPNFIDYKMIYFSIMIGYLSHLLLDCFTEEGLPLLFPIKIHFGIPPFKHWRITTGKWFEKFIIFPGILGYIVWFLYNNWERIFNLFK